MDTSAAPILSIGTRVFDPSLALIGVITRVRDDETGEAIYTAQIEDNELHGVPNGYMLYRKYEVVSVSETINLQQCRAVLRKYRHNPDGTTTISSFFSRVIDYGDYVGLSWCGMFLGIEKDGYTHS